jgi:hypothetical protein
MVHLPSGIILMLFEGKNGLGFMVYSQDMLIRERKIKMVVRTLLF